MNSDNDFRLLSLGLALWVGAACKGLLQSYWFMLAIPLLLFIGKRFGTLLLLAAVAGVFNFGIHQIAIAHNDLKQFMKSHEVVSITAEVKNDPKLGVPKVVGSTLHSASTSFLGTSIRINGGKIRLPLRFTSQKPINLIPGSVFNSEATVLATKERSVAGLIVLHGDLKIIHGASIIGRATNQIRRSFKLVIQKFSGDGAKLIPGLVLGDTSLESNQFVTQMRRSGLTHLTAVSGENFAIISVFVLWALQWVFKKMKIRILITAVILIGFIFLVRPSPSVLRASIMTAALLSARASGLRNSALPSLGFAITLLILIDPFQAIDPGFALSVGATAGILLIAPRLKEKIAEPIAIPLAATILCTPIIIAISGQFSLISIPANLLVSVAIAPITITGFVAALIAPFFPYVSFLIIACILPFANWIAYVAHHASSFSLLVLPKSFAGAVIAIFVLILIAKKMWKSTIMLIGIAICFIYFQSATWPGSQWRIVNCDVGQGDAEAINLGDHQAIVIDTGPDPALMDSCLKSLHIESIPLLVITHNHADHYGGLEGALRNRTVGEIWRTALKGQHLAFDAPIGHIDIQILWPKDPNATYEASPGDGSAINNTSISMLVDIAGLKFFTAGDAEPPVQEEMLASGAIHSVDIIKVCHHGSAYQYLPLLDALHPKFAFISVGKGNPYGHPAQSTLDALTERGIKVFRTDTSGALEIDADQSIHTKKNSPISFG